MRSAERPECRPHLDLDGIASHNRGLRIFRFCRELQKAEFERDVIRERTHAGLSAARARGRKGGRPKGVPINAESTACAAETLYREGKLSSQEIAGRLQISKSTLYSYLRHRGVPIGPYRVLDKRRPNRRNEHA
jgi:DNA invertase Pin-like site-specific DNA recombinase